MWERKMLLGESTFVSVKNNRTERKKIITHCITFDNLTQQAIKNHNSLGFFSQS